MKNSDTLQHLLGIICSVFDAYSAVLFVPASDSGVKEDVFYLAKYFSLGEEVIQDVPLVAGQALVGWIIRNKKPLLINKFDSKRSHLGYYDPKAEKKIKAFMGCPLQGGGALCLDSRRTYSLSDKDQKILELFSRLANTLWHKTSTQKQAEAEHHYYQSMQELQFLRKKYPDWSQFLSRFLAILSEATGFSYAFLATRDERGEYFFLEDTKSFTNIKKEQSTVLCFPIKSGLVGWVFTHQQPVYGDSDSPKSQSLFGKNDISPALQSVILLPVTLNRITRAVVVLGNPVTVSVTPALKAFVEMAVDHLTLFLENLYLRTHK